MRAYFMKTRSLTIYTLIHISLHSTIINASDIDINQSGQRNSTLLDVGTQSNDQNIKLRQSGIENMLDIGIGRSATAVINQHGDFGLVDLQLDGQNESIRVDQSGVNNDLIGSFTGQSNNTFIEQYGSSNLIDMEIGGQSNKINLTQGGNHNKLHLTHHKNNDRINLNQFGNNNRMNIDHSSSNIGLDVTQDGSRGSVLVTN